MEVKALDKTGIDFLIKEEGISLVPYKDSVGIPTIGIGNTYYENGEKVKMTDPPISKDRAINLFKSIVKTYETAVWSLTRDDITQNQFNALVSLCYNIGVAGFKGSTLLRKVNENPQSDVITYCFRMWSKQPELLPRRNREAALYHL